MAGFSNFFPEDVPGAIPGGTYNEGDIVVFDDNFYGATASVTLSDPVVETDFDTGWALLSGGGGGVENNTTANTIPYWDGDSLEDSSITRSQSQSFVVDNDSSTGNYAFGDASVTSTTLTIEFSTADRGEVVADYNVFIGGTITFPTIDSGDDFAQLSGNTYTIDAVNMSRRQLIINDTFTEVDGGRELEVNFVEVGSEATVTTPGGRINVGSDLTITGSTTLATALTGILRADSGVVSVASNITADPIVPAARAATVYAMGSIVSNGGEVYAAATILGTAPDLDNEDFTDTSRWLLLSSTGLTNNTTANRVPYWDGDSFEDSAIAFTAASQSTQVTGPLTVTGETTLDTNLTGFLRADSGVVSTGTIDTIENNTTANHLPYWDGDSLEDSAIEHTPSMPESMGDETLATPTTLFQGTQEAPPQPTNNGFFFEGDQTSTFSLGDAIQAPDGEIVHITINPNTAAPVRYLPDQGFQPHSGGPNGVNDSGNDANPLGGDDVRVTQVAYFPDNTWTLGDSVTLGTATYAAESPAVTYTNINFIGGDYSDYQPIRMFSSAFSGSPDAGEDAFIAAAQVGDYYRFDALTTTGTNQMAWGAALVNSIFVVTDVGSNSLRGELVSNYTPAGIVGQDENNGSTVSFTKMEITFTANQTTVPAVPASTTVTSDLTVTGDTTLDTDLTVTGDTTLGGDLTVNGTIGDLTVTGEINGGTDTSPTLFVEGGTGGTAQQGAYQFRVVGSGEGGAAGYITFELE